LLGLELGADDYIYKPFSLTEVVARVKTVLRRTGGGETVSSAELALDESTYRAMINGHDLARTALEFKLLLYLASNPGRIHSRQQLLDRIYQDDRTVGDRTIDTLIKKLRKKIAAVATEADLILSVYGVGYKFEPAGIIAVERRVGAVLG
jgi:two-component system, OmpR family, response regulator BaeR